MIQRLPTLLLAGASLLAAAAPAGQEAAPTTPSYEVDPYWPQELPHDWLLGNVVGVATDSQDNVWIIHRPNSQRGAEGTPPVIAFAPDGSVVEAWGGPRRGVRLRAHRPTASTSINVITSGWASAAGSRTTSRRGPRPTTRTSSSSRRKAGSCCRSADFGEGRAGSTSTAVPRATDRRLRRPGRGRGCTSAMATRTGASSSLTRARGSTAGTGVHTGTLRTTPGSPGVRPHAAPPAAVRHAALRGDVSRTASSTSATGATSGCRCSGRTARSWPSR